jgi:hypothetical protein
MELLSCWHAGALSSFPNVYSGKDLAGATTILQNPFAMYAAANIVALPARIIPSKSALFEPHWEHGCRQELQS